ncbi:flagellar filament capping protein FliD [Entomospira entomophila]|uniref:Flagellar hook-associated protein 2 n=1 Tax=Entomospira entomophila TaxID=2719988 RepID=A0A968GB93_9SPIO|nr:flagellar filament capping protein FliD [Entomospira entomophilus]NIZ40448.1 flagellar filament capping protein FliD [Entomospira entomophilus]WDI36006.1 flagellar filament capping protein FliD [Entomospira entomophilus]
MAELGVPGISSQYDQYIERLVELAKVRRKPLEERLEETKLRRTVWTDLNRRLLELERVGSRLYGFDNVFGNRIATSSNEQVAIIRPRRGIDPVDVQVQVNQIASADRFSSRPIDDAMQVEAGEYRFTVGQEEIAFTFAGGTLAEFTESLNQVNADILRASLVQSGSKEQTWFLESRVIGADNPLGFEGKSRDLAFQLGVITDQVDLQFFIENDTNNANMIGRPFDTRNEISLNSGRMLELGVDATDNRILEGSVLTIRYSAEERTRPTVSYLIGGGGVESREQALREGRILPIPEENSPYDLPVLRSEENLFIRVNNQVVSLASLDAKSVGEDGLLEISLDQFAGQQLQSIIFNNADGMHDFTVKQIELQFPNLTDWSPTNATSRAQDAEFSLDGVRITRDTNVIEDLLPGQTLELRSASSEMVDMSVTYDTESVREAIQEFLLIYNWTMAHVNFAVAMQGNESVVDNTAYFFNDKELENAREILGLLQGDQQLNSLKSRLHMQMISAHAVGEEGDRLMSLGDLGIATRARGSIGTSADRLGYFAIHDEKRFEEALATRWDDIRDLFARDPEIGVFESGLVGGRDNGIMTISRSYTQAPRGVVATRTTLINSEIERNEKALDAFDEDLERKRQQWERDFAAAENAQRELERIQSQIEGMNRSQNR